MPFLICHIFLPVILRCIIHGCSMVHINTQKWLQVLKKDLPEEIGAANSVWPLVDSIHVSWHDLLVVSSMSLWFVLEIEFIITMEQIHGSKFTKAELCAQRLHWLISLPQADFPTVEIQIELIDLAPQKVSALNRGETKAQDGYRRWWSRRSDELWQETGSECLFQQYAFKKYQIIPARLGKTKTKIASV